MILKNISTFYINDLAEVSQLVNIILFLEPTSGTRRIVCSLNSIFNRNALGMVGMFDSFKLAQGRSNY
jgi:hypothetical protein